MDQEYTLVYRADNSDMLAKNRQVIQSLEQVNAELDKVKTQAQGAFAAVGQSAAGASEGTKGVAQSFAALGGAMIVLREVSGALDAIGAGLVKAREYAVETAEANIKLRDTMRELANLKGQPGPNDQVTGATLDFSTKTGYTVGEATKFLEQFEGSIPAGRDKKNIAPDMEGTLATEAGRFGARLGLDAKTAGDLGGVMPQYGKVTSAEQAAGVLGGVAFGLNEGRGKITLLTRAMLGVAGSTVEEEQGRFHDLSELAVATGVASTFSRSESQAGTVVKQINRLFNRQQGETGAWLKSIGITGREDFATSIERIAPHVAGPEGTDTLRGHGFGQNEEIASVIAFSRQLQVFRERNRKAAEIVRGGGGRVMVDNNRFLNETITGQNRRGEAELSRAEFLRGREGEWANVGHKYAEARLRAGKEIDTPATNATDEFWDWVTTGPRKLTGDPGMREGRVQAEMSRALVEGGEKVGVDVRKRFPQILGGYQDVNRQAFNELAPEIIGRGGNPFGGGEKAEKLLQELVDIERRKEGGRRGAAPGNPQRLPPDAPDHGPVRRGQ